MENITITIYKYELVQIYELLIIQKEMIQNELKEKKLSDKYINKQKAKIQTIENLINRIEVQL